jgi:phage terminase small subunit
MKLTSKQKKFADEYIKTGNAKQSAIEAGYSKKTAKVVGYENLTKPYLKEYIDERMKQLASSRIMTAQEVLERLTGIVKGEITETVVVATPTGIGKTEKTADFKTQISAMKEIMRRYPNNDKLVEQQIRKLSAEADIIESKAKMLTELNNNDDNIIIVDRWQNDETAD